MTLNILIADDHSIVRKGLRSLIEAESDFRVVGEAGDGLKAVQLAEQLQPDILILDILMPGLGGLDVAHQVAQRVPTARIIILSMHSNEPYVLAALDHGVMGYVLKDSATEELILAIRQVMDGKHYLSSTISERAIGAYIERARASRSDPYNDLTDREREVLHLAAEGLSNTEIASRLSIGARTVETHRANMMRKLSLQNQVDLIRYAFSKGLIE
jgi:two-component system, NarL family, response regulator NreC